MLITGHYEFEILIKTLTNYKERTIFRRFSDIEWLHKGLVKYNPGCRIPIIPEKNLWANLNVNNDQLLEKRKKLIEEYLNYINRHIFLSLNPNYIIFLSDDFEKNRIDNDKKDTLYEKITHYTSKIPSIFKSEKMKGLTSIDDNKKLEKDRENLVRLLKAVNDLKINMQEFLKINEEKTEAVKNLLLSAKKIQNVSLDFNYSVSILENNSSISSSIDDDNFQLSKTDKTISKNLEIINSFYEKNKLFQNLVVSSVRDQLEKYEIELKGLIEIFERKEREEIKLTDFLKDKYKIEEKEEEINEQKYILENLNHQLLQEIINFKNYRENDLLNIMKKFLKDKAENNLETGQIFDFMFNKND